MLFSLALAVAMAVGVLFLREMGKALGDFGPSWSNTLCGLDVCMGWNIYLHDDRVCYESIDSSRHSLRNIIKNIYINQSI